MKLGQYGKYQGRWYIVVALRGHLILIMGEGGNKLQIKASNFEPREGNVAKQVRYEGMDYLITKDKKIISLQTNKFMQWHETHPIRNAILNLSGIDRCKQVLRYSQAELPL